MDIYVQQEQLTTIGNRTRNHDETCRKFLLNATMIPSVAGRGQIFTHLA